MGKVRLADITRHDVRAWAAQMRRDGLSAATVQRVVHLLSASLTAAVDAEVLAATPPHGCGCRLGSRQPSGT